jgi:hypothetical protein
VVNDERGVGFPIADRQIGEPRLELSVQFPKDLLSDLEF